MNLKDKPEVDVFICQKIQYVVEYAKVWIDHAVFLFLKQNVMSVLTINSRRCK